MIEAFGIAGAILLALCAAPQAILSYKQKHSSGVSSTFLSMWFFGEILMLAYVAIVSPDWILISNYILNIVLVGVIIYYKVFGVEP